MSEVEYSSSRWFDILTYYQNIKKLYRLTSHDIVRQLCEDLKIPFSYDTVSRLSKIYLISPTTLSGAFGRDTWDILVSGMKKSNWKSSTSTYNEKLREKIIDGEFQGYHVNTIEELPNKRPKVAVCIMNKKYMVQDTDQPTKLMLENMLTIDGIIPNVVEISQGYYL